MTAPAMHPIVALWCHPRSMSTAVERTMRERGDVACFHEPFMYYYYVHLGRRSFPHFDLDEHKPVTWEAIRGQLLDAAAAGPVFLKDMSFYVLDRMREDVELATRMRNAFLVRDPLHSVLSYHELDPDLTLEEVGLEAQWRHFEWLLQVGPEVPVVLDAELIQARPAPVLRAWWDQAGLPFVAGGLDWGTGSAMPRDWGDVAGWHVDVSAARGIESRDARVDRRALEARLDAVSGLRSLYEHHLPFYDRLRAHRLEPAEKCG